MWKSFLAGSIILGMGVLVHAECVQGDCYNGRGAWRYGSGAVYDGQFQQGKRHGRGELHFSNGNLYTGEFNLDFRQGHGQMFYTDGAIYKGSFFRDRFHGQGEMTYPDGRKYKGNWVSGEMEGQGELVMTDGSTYEGLFQHGRFQGEGKMTYANGEIYLGEWKTGKREGAGIMIKQDGRKIAGQWLNDKQTGNEKELLSSSSTPVNPDYTYSDGSRYVGTLTPDGMPEGFGKCYYADGEYYEGGWKGHAPNGEGVLTRKDGRRLKGIWSLGKLITLYEDERPLPITKITPVRDQQVRTWAVVVGVAHYPTLQRLEYPDDDAYQMFAFLRSPEGGAIPENQIRLLINEEATRTQLISAIQEMFGRADENDIILFYFSGHGLDGSILPVDFDGWDQQLYYKELVTLLDASLARQKLVIADACHAGSMMAGNNGATPAMDPLGRELSQTGGGTAVLLSSQQDEFSLEDNRLKAGIFSYYLRKGMQGNADTDFDKTIRIGELFRYVNKEVGSYTKGKQTPMIRGVFDDMMPVAFIRPQG